MRPVRLAAQGFTAFRDRIEVDFEGVDFFALVGPTGSGKSSVIDAICFALYGSVPRYEDRRAVAPALTTGAAEARVSLTFDVGTERYLATRVVRRLPKGGATTREARLERVTGDTTEVLAGNADEVSDRVSRLLGLSFDYFTKCVVLPQGEFAKFLHDKPAERQQLLSNLLNFEIYARMGQRARQEAEAGRNQARFRQERLAELAFATPEARVAAEQGARSLEALRERLAAAEPGIAELDRELTEHEAAAREAGALVGKLDEIAVPAPVRAAATEMRDLELAVAAAEDCVVKAETNRKELEAEVRRMPEVASLEVAAKAHSQLRRIAAELAKVEAHLVALRRRSQDAGAAAEAAARQGAAAREGLERLRREHSAADLAHHLVVGQPCPVCALVVERLPDVVVPADLSEAQTAVKKAEDEHRLALGGASAATAEVAKAETNRANLVQRREEEAGRVADHPDEERLNRAIALVKERRQQLDTARAAEDEAHKRHRLAVKQADAARSSLTAAWRWFNEQRDAVAQLRPPVPEPDDVLATWSALAAWAKDQRASLVEAAERSRAAAERCAEERRETLRQLRDLCAKEGVEPPEEAPLADLRERATDAARDAKNRVAAITEGISETKRINAEVARLREESDVADLLASHLKASGFERWLVAEALDLLVGGASATLLRLSAGQYSLDRDERNEFLVVDHRSADERRPAKTLSGGETFQASLALALALADQLAGLAADGAVRLESIFLDEGFGSLDPEALALVADTIETLGSDERMVGIVTHVRELAERVPVRYEVTKSARSSTVERRTA